MPNQNDISSTTQQFLDIYDIVNDLVIMKNGAASMILTLNAINFGLLAEEEQDAIIYAYAGLLNSLNYTIQIIIGSQTKDVTSYLNLLEEQADKAADQNKRDRIRRYREFVSNLIQERNVLDKKFYVVIPASALEMGLLPPQSVIPGVKETSITTLEKSAILEKAQNILEPKREHLISLFGRIGLLARQLTTQEIIQLFYISYNPEAAEGQQITNSKSYTVPMVQAQIRGVSMMDSKPTNPTATPTGSTASSSSTSSTSSTAPISPITPGGSGLAGSSSVGSQSSGTSPSTSAAPSASTTAASPTPTSKAATAASAAPVVSPPTAPGSSATSTPSGSSSSSTPSPTASAPSAPSASSPSSSGSTPAAATDSSTSGAQAAINSSVGAIGTSPTPASGASAASAPTSSPPVAGAPSGTSASPSKPADDKMPKVSQMPPLPEI